MTTNQPWACERPTIPAPYSADTIPPSEVEGWLYDELEEERDES
jgi:hypothetical protein